MIYKIYQQKFPTLELNEELVLREQKLTDTPHFFEYYTHPEVAKHILAANPKTLTEANSEINYCRNLFYQRQGIYWTIARKSDNRMIGAIGLYINNFHHRAEICYDLSRDYWRQGITKQAIERVLNYLFHHTDIVRVEAVTVAENIASSGVLKKLGFNYEGDLKQYRYFNHQSYDVGMYAITASEYLAASQPISAEMIA